MHPLALWPVYRQRLGRVWPRVADPMGRAAIDAAEALGDERIPERAQGQVRPETWTHGSAAERREWFMAGLERGTLTA